MAQYSIVIPAYNEQEGIGPVLQSLRALNLDSELIVVDDGSTDATSQVAAQNGAKVIRHPINAGYGASVKDAVRSALTDIIIVTDADGTYPIDQIPVLLAKFSEGFDMVVGARSGAAYRGSFLKMPARIVFKFLVEFTTGSRIPDINSGLRVFRKSTVERYFPDICNGFSFTTTITLIYLLTGKSVGYLPIDYHHRIGRSKVKIIRDTLRTLQYITECIVRYNPLKLFLLLSLFTLVIGAVGIVFAGLFSLFFGVFTAIIVFAMGLIAETMRRPRQ